MSMYVIKAADEDFDEDKDQKLKERRKLNDTTPYEYFRGHECHLDAEQISKYNLKMNFFRKFIFYLISVRSNDVRALNLYRSYAALSAEKYRHYTKHPFIIHPFSRLRLFFEVTNVILMLILGLYLAVYYSEVDYGSLDIHVEMIYVCDFIFVINIIANFFTGYIEGHTCKAAVYDLDKIAFHYIKTWLLIDVLSSISFIPYVYNHPYNLVAFLLESVNILRLPRIMIYLKNILVVLRASILQFHFSMKYIIALFGAESARAKYYIMQKQIEHYMVQRKFGARLKKKILKFYALRFQSKYFTESLMLGCVSGQLRDDILMHTGRQLVRELEFLKLLPRSLLMQIVFKLRVVIFIAGDVIIKINTIGDCLYFIDKGTVAIYSDAGQEICHLEDGDFFGEIALVMNRYRTASAVAVTNCELFRLDKTDFDNTIAYYPTVYETIKKMAINRFETTCVLDEHRKADVQHSEGNDLRNG
ncbi:unnamed protein product [Arctia plantaginis]|uniref:Cyclic nucleotide-binding domain-containing protein n=1 Tax=Arctia plantaginis TaxID=874455 RepID=A0A8S1BPW4_ARCPL|nr:unnamed protein product [Arctia plantaginis]